MTKPEHTFDDEDVDLDNEVVIVDGKRFTEQDAEDLAHEIASPRKDCD